MMKKMVALLIYGCSFATFACPNALATDDLNFCASFKTAATCYCTSSGLPSGMCQDTGAIYRRMIAVFGSLQRACEYQRYTSTQDCIDNWGCYLLGGVDSQDRLCNATRHACA